MKKLFLISIITLVAFNIGAMKRENPYITDNNALTIKTDPSEQKTYHETIFSREEIDIAHVMAKLSEPNQKTKNPKKINLLTASSDHYNLRGKSGRFTKKSYTHLSQIHIDLTE